MERGSLKHELLALGICALSIALAHGSGRAGSPVSAVSAGELERPPLKVPRSAPERVVTVALLPEELLVDILEPARWVGISHVADWPGSSAVSARFPDKARRTSGTPEAILSLNPDLVILSDYNQPTTETLLENAGVPAWRVHAVSTLPELFVEWRKLGALVHRAPAVDELVQAAEARYVRLQGSVPTSSALFLQGRYGYARGALQVDCPERAGFRNLLPGDQRGATPKLSEEELATLKPDFLFLAAPVAVARKVLAGDLPSELPPGAFDDPSTKAFLVPEALMGSISQLALDSCELYVSLALRGAP